MWAGEAGGGGREVEVRAVRFQAASRRSRLRERNRWGAPRLYHRIPDHEISPGAWWPRHPYFARRWHLPAQDLPGAGPSKTRILYVFQMMRSTAKVIGWVQQVSEISIRENVPSSRALNFRRGFRGGDKPRLREFATTQSLRFSASSPREPTAGWEGGRGAAPPPRPAGQPAGGRGVPEAGVPRAGGGLPAPRGPWQRAGEGADTLRPRCLEGSVREGIGRGPKQLNGAIRIPRCQNPAQNQSKEEYFWAPPNVCRKTSGYVFVMYAGRARGGHTVAGGREGESGMETRVGQGFRVQG